MPVPPDMRSIILGDGGGIDRTQGKARDPFEAPATMANLPQAILTRQPDVISYKESEMNLFISSADRDWVTTGAVTKDSRYNFTIHFDPAGIPITNRGTPPAFPSHESLLPVLYQIQYLII